MTPLSTHLAQQTVYGMTNLEYTIKQPINAYATNKKEVSIGIIIKRFSKNLVSDPPLRTPHSTMHEVKLHQGMSNA